MKDMKIDFGYQQVDLSKKEYMVKNVFDSVVYKYDLMNDIMSFFIHRIWKDIAVFYCNVKRGDKILDLAGGTGDLSKRFINLVGDNGEVILGDINFNMLKFGRDKLIKQGLEYGIKYVQLNAEYLPFFNDYFNIVSIGFGLRNVTNKLKALKSIYRVLKSGGMLMILEFSHPINDFISSIYDLYSFNVLPKFGKMICGNEFSYKYLVESIRVHPDQKELLKIIKLAEFKECYYVNLCNGIVSIHIGIKY
ncbi:MAG: class I SAM-dependent methyltransferase [Candidatus Azosocius agrarius]|nr:MAG: class I SAM-dependent methyltransferase [Gammaproteobacteria bacterium]